MVVDNRKMGAKQLLEMLGVERHATDVDINEQDPGQTGSIGTTWLFAGQAGCFFKGFSTGRKPGAGR